MEHGSNPWRERKIFGVWKEPWVGGSDTENHDSTRLQVRLPLNEVLKVAVNKVRELGF